MTWADLAFLHWPVPVAPLRARVPAELEIDTFEGSAYVGVVPFEMRRTRFALAPPVPTATTFLELNLRTYVRHGKRAGVWFFSLDAASWLAVRGARATFALPYYDAKISASEGDEGWHEWGAVRSHRGVPAAEFIGRYRPTGPAARSEPGTLEHFLTERYSLFSQVGYGVDRALRRCLLRGDIEHEPWPLQPAECELEVNDMFSIGGIELSAEERLRPPLVHFARGVDVRAFMPRRSVP